MKQTLIGFGHKARQGKMRAAKAIHCALPEKTMILSFADALKAYCRVNGWMEGKDSGLLQFIGTDLFRKMVADNWWIRILEDTITEVAADYGAEFVLVPDVRFKNEAEWIREHGFLIRVDRLLEERVQYIDPDRPCDHASETNLDGWPRWDGIISAMNGDVVGLAQKALEVFHKLTARPLQNT